MAEYRSYVSVGPSIDTEKVVKTAYIQFLQGLEALCEKLSFS